MITSRWDLRDVEVAYRMFERWRQENFFKYMREEFLLDALIDYQIEPEDPTRTIPNPERRALDKEIQAARADLARLEREYGDGTGVVRIAAYGKLGKQLRMARDRVAQLCAQRQDLPKRVEVRDLNERAVVKLAIVLTCNTIHARKCELKFVCRSPGGKTAPGFSLRGRGHPKNARGGAEHACCCACYVPVRGRRDLLFCQPVQIDDEGSL